MQTPLKSAYDKLETSQANLKEAYRTTMTLQEKLKEKDREIKKLRGIINSARLALGG